MSVTPEAAQTAIPKGVWRVDPAHSKVGFAVKHMGVATVRGEFGEFEGSLEIGDDIATSRASGTVKTASVDTNQEQRDGHLRSADFFEVDAHKAVTFRSTRVRRDGEDYMVDGELTLKSITKPISLRLELGGFGPDPFGGTRAGFSAIGELKRSDFGVDFNAVLEAGGVVVGDRVDIYLEIEAVLNA